MTEIGVWHVTSRGPQKLNTGRVNLESKLEEWIFNDPDLLEAGLKIIGRQMIFSERARLDLLGLDLQGNFVVIEIKRGEVNRETLMQAIDYGSSIAFMPYAELSSRVSGILGKENSLDTLLEERGAEAGDRDEMRSVRIYIVGTGRQPGLERMVDFLAGFQMPISVASFDVFNVGENEQILVRELTDAELELPERKIISKASLEGLIALADQNGNGRGFQELLQAAEQHGFYPRLYPKCIMFTPPSNRTRLLFTIWTKSKIRGQVRAYIGLETFAEFYPVSTQEALAKLGPNGWRRMSYEEVKQFIAGLDQLFAKITEKE